MSLHAAIRVFVTGILLLVFVSGNAQEIKKRRGTVKYKYPNGKLMVKGKVRNHKMQGVWKSWDQDGHLISTGTYKNDTLHGEYKAYSPDGKITEQGTYSKGRKTGTWRMYFANGALVSENNFVNDQMSGEQSTWYANGNKREFAVMSHGILMERRAWYENGRIKLSESYLKGERHGVWVTYPEPVTPSDTFPATIDEYSFGKREGRHLAYSGKVKIEEFHYHNDKLDGSCTKWDHAGRMEMYEVYSAGRMSGTCEYYRNGMLIRKVNYVNDYKHGTETDFDRDGRKLKTSWYKMGVLDSVFTYYPNGKQMSALRYSSGKQTAVSTANYVEWDSLGIKLIEGEYTGEKKSGKWTSFYPNGRVRSLTNYVNGNIEGLYTKWYPSGKKLIEMHVFANGINTQPDVWDEKGRVIKSGTKTYNELVESNKPGEVLNDPSRYNRAIISRRVEEVQFVEVEGAEDYGFSDAIVEEPISIEYDTNAVFAWPEVAPEFPGGSAAMLDFIASNIVYPTIAKENNHEGKVFVKFVVEKNGAVSNVQVLRGVPGAPELSAEAIRVVKLFPLFHPATNNGKVVRSECIIPVKFSLR